VRGKEHDDASEVKFESYLETSKEYLGRTYEIAKSLGDAIRVGLSALKTQAGKKHLFILANPSVGDAGALSEDLAGDFSGARIHAVVWDHARQELRESLRELARKSNGRFTQSLTARDFIRTLISVRAAQFGSFELSWKPLTSGTNDTVRISCNSPYGSGEVLLRHSPERFSS
jgi:hypothetical protein